MKILKISFKNIHSLEGEHIIDFEEKRFSQTNLFAIIGATGSGKSTILDVIALALYNQMPRLSRISPNEIQKSGAIITHGKTEAYARVKYHCEKGIFSSEWIIHIKKTGTIDNIQMQLYDALGTPLKQNKQDTLKANIKNIGLTYEQFIKSVLLAQGDFALFLKVNKKERSALLEQITGTEIYRIIGKSAFEKNKISKLLLKSLEETIQLFQDKLLSEEDYLAQKETLTENEQTILSSQNQLAILEKQATHKQKTIEIAQKITSFDNKITENNTKLSIFQQDKGKTLDLHQKTDSFSEELIQWKNISTEIHQNEQKLSQKLTEKERLISKKEEILSEIQHFIQKKCNETSILTELEHFRQEIISLQNQRAEKQNECRNQIILLTTELKPLQIVINSKTDFSALQHDVQEKKKILTQQETELKNLLVTHNLLPTEHNISLLQETIKTTQKAEKKAFEIEQSQLLLSQTKKEISQLNIDIDPLPEEIKQINEQIKKQTKELKYLRIEKENADLKKSLEDHRKNLAEGKPCPLCGSTHHPWAYTSDNEINTLAEQIVNQEKKVQEWQKKLTTKENTFSISNERISILENKVSTLSNEILEKKNDFFQEFPTYKLTENWAEKQIETENKIQIIKEYQQIANQTQAIEKGLPIIRNLLEIIPLGTEITKKLNQKIGDKNINEQTNEYQTLWNNWLSQNHSICQQINDLETKLKEQSKQKDILNNHLIKKIKFYEFKSIEEALSARLPFEQANELSIEKQQLENSLKTLQAQKDIISTEYQLLKSQDIAISAEELTKNIHFFQEKINNIQKNIDETRYILRNHEENKQEIASLDKRIQYETEKNRVWRLLDTLIGDATGAKFNQFAQDLTLQQLIQLANRQLIHLSPRYLLSQPTENEDDSLIIIDNDMGGKRRSVKTLSGGETFILSLALALALSDLASNNVKINSLFIDEGFGTLDPETLDQTLDTLERLQQESNKMIGIISHVEALKERIPTQIRLKQKGSGFSTLSVIP